MDKVFQLSMQTGKRRKLIKRLELELQKKKKEEYSQALCMACSHMKKSYQHAVIMEQIDSAQLEDRMRFHNKNAREPKHNNSISITYN